MVTGTLDPDVTGIYSEAGVVNGQPYYSRDAGGLWYISMFVPFGGGGNYWQIADSIGGFSSNPFWSRPIGDPIEGEYSPYLGATGTATVVLFDESSSSSSKSSQSSQSSSSQSSSSRSSSSSTGEVDYPRTVTIEFSGSLTATISKPTS